MWGASEKFKNLKRFIFRHRPIQKGQKTVSKFRWTVPSRHHGNLYLAKVEIFNLYQ